MHSFPLIFIMLGSKPDKTGEIEPESDKKYHQSLNYITNNDDVRMPE